MPTSRNNREIQQQPTGLPHYKWSYLSRLCQKQRSIYSHRTRKSSAFLSRRPPKAPVPTFQYYRLSVPQLFHKYPRQRSATFQSAADNRPELPAAVHHPGYKSSSDTRPPQSGGHKSIRLLRKPMPTHLHHIQSDCHRKQSSLCLLTANRRHAVFRHPEAGCPLQQQASVPVHCFPKIQPRCSIQCPKTDCQQVYSDCRRQKGTQSPVPQ